MVGHRGWRLPGVLAVTCVALASVLALTLSMETEPAGGKPASSASGPPQRVVGNVDGSRGAGMVLSPAHDYDEIIERPLFHKSRRPEAAGDPEAEVSAVTARPDLLLRGTVVADSGHRIALVQVVGTDTVERVLEGQTLEGWTVRRVDSDRIVMEQRGGTTEYSLDETYRAGPQPARPHRGIARRMMRSGLDRLEDGLTEMEELPEAPDTHQED